MDPVQFLEGALGAAFGVGSAWMALKAALKNVTLTVQRHDAAIDAHATKFYEQLDKIAALEKASLKLEGALQIELVRITARAEAMQQDLNERANAAEKLERKFDSATRWQNETLMGIAGKVGVTRKDSSQYKAASEPRSDPRAESDSDAPPKPYRARLPTLRGRDE